MSELPPEVLARMGPLLSWVEGAEGLRLPLAWIADQLPFAQREQAWLVREFPTYSYDNVDDVIRLGRQSAVTEETATKPASMPGGRLAVEPPPGYELNENLGRLAERYFCWSGNELAIRSGVLLELHELALRFPVQHLIIHCYARAVATGYLHADRTLTLPETLGGLHTTSHSFRTVVGRGLCEGHMHLWGVLSGNEVWADQLLRRLEPGVLETFEPAERRLLVLGRLAVRLLAMGLLFDEDHQKMDPPMQLIGYLDDFYHSSGLAQEQRIQKRMRLGFALALKDLCKGPIGRGEEEVGWLIGLLDPVVSWERTGRSQRRSVHQRIALLRRLHQRVQEELFRLGSILGPRHAEKPSRDPAIEMLAARQQFLHQVFFRYLVYHCHHWQLATQSGKTTGLRQFRRFFGARQRQLLSAHEEHGLILKRLRSLSPLHSVEGRVSPPSRGFTDLVPWVLGYADALRRGELKKFGLVIHFIKQDRDEDDRTTGVGALPSLRHGEVRRVTRKRALQLYGLLRTPHPVVPFIVGIDAANLELPTPPEVFAPAFRFLRDHPIELQRMDVLRRRLGCYEEIESLVRGRRLGMTYHVGEEFRHILSGLRAIHEAIDFLGAGPGDRLGHAIALALDPKVWAEQIGYQAPVPKLEWLDDLVWLHHLLGPGNDLIGELEIEDCIQLLVRGVYGSGGDGHGGNAGELPPYLSPPTLYDAWRLRALDPHCLRLDDLLVGQATPIRQVAHGRPQIRWLDVQRRHLATVNRDVGSEDAFRLVGRYWYDPRLRRAGRGIQVVDMEARRETWLEVCRQAQRKVQALVRRRQIVIEVNPTINRVIGPMGRLSDHHVFRMTLDADGMLDRKLRVTVNTDDPGVVNSSLTHEFYLLAAVLSQKGVPEARIEEWLEWLRRSGHDFSFLSTLPDPSDHRIRAVLTELERLHPTLARKMSGVRPSYLTSVLARGTSPKATHDDPAATGPTPGWDPSAAGGKPVSRGSTALT